MPAQDEWLRGVLRLITTAIPGKSSDGGNSLFLYYSGMIILIAMSYPFGRFNHTMRLKTQNNGRGCLFF